MLNGGTAGAGRHTRRNPNRCAALRRRGMQTDVSLAAAISRVGDGSRPSQIETRGRSTPLDRPQRVCRRRRCNPQLLQGTQATLICSNSSWPKAAAARSAGDGSRGRAGSAGITRMASGAAGQRQQRAGREREGLAAPGAAEQRWQGGQRQRGPLTTAVARHRPTTRPSHP